MDLGECEGCEVLGHCCYIKVEISGRLFRTDVACPFLHPELKVCVRYETRLEVPWCNKAGEVPMPVGCEPHFDPNRVAVEEIDDAEIRRVANAAAMELLTARVVRSKTD